MRKIIAGNWKMNLGGADAASFATGLAEGVKPIDLGGCEVIVCVPFTAIKGVADTLKNSKVAVGAQNVSFADSGAYTGEISADMLKEAGATYAIIGHSERRAMFGETDESVKKRTIKALEKGLIPIVCVGETLVERQSEKTAEVLKTQLSGAFDGFNATDIGKIILAYEPVWAIGTGLTASSQQAAEAVNFIRTWFKDNFKTVPPILYGGSMNASNAGELLSAGIDGGLIGGASLKKDDFLSIIKIASNL